MQKVRSNFSSMFNQAAVEAMYSAHYVEDYLDCVENLPDDIQRSISQLRELDQQYQEILQELDQFQDILIKDVDPGTRKRTILQIQRALIKSQDLGDEKLQIQQQIQDVIENKARQLDIDFKNLDCGRDHEHHPDNNRNDTQPERVSKRSRRQRNHDSYTREEIIHEKEMISSSAHLAMNFGNYGSGGAMAGTKKKKKKRKTKAERDNSPIEPPIDPNEPTYCLCEQVSYGEMIGCDNDECTIEWFHFSCVGLTTKPKGKWYCPKCRGDRSNQMKPKVS